MSDGGPADQRLARDDTGATLRLRRPAAGPSGPIGTLLRWLWNHGFRLLFVLDAVGLYAVALSINLFRFGLHWPRFRLYHYLVGFVIATTVQLLVNYFGGLYERQPRLGTPPWLPRVAVAMVIGVGIDSLITLFSERYLMPRANLIAFFLLGCVVLMFNRALSDRLAQIRRGPSRVLLVGKAGPIEVTAAHLGRGAGGRVTKVVGSVERTDELLDAVVDTNPTDILLLDLAAFEPMFPEPLSTLDDIGIGIHQRVGAHETLLGLRSVREIAGLPFTRIRTHSMSPHQEHLKRLFDLIVLLVCSPLILAVLGGLWLYVRVRAGRPVIYRQRRVGRDGSTFVLVKFRTMRPDAEAAGPQLSGKGDPRIIRGLSWMRTTRADELPQVWNVLRGEMSLVGPRPERPELIEEIEPRVPGYGRRHSLVPGLTGLAQVQGRYDTPADDKLGYDLQYAVNWSLLLDIQIILRTVWTVVTGRV